MGILAAAYARRKKWEAELLAAVIQGASFGGDSFVAAAGATMGRYRRIPANALMAHIGVPAFKGR